MDSQINTGSGAAIQGDANAGRDFVGRDQTINNIVVLSNFLHYAQVEGLFPKIQQAKDFSSLTEAVESALGARLTSDLAEATAFAGEVLGDFVSEQIPSDPRKPVSLKSFISDLVNHIARHLKETGHWDAYSQSMREYTNRNTYVFNAIPLETTLMLWNKQFNPNKMQSAFIKDISPPGSFYALFIDFDDDIAKFNTRELRVLIGGIVLDLIRISSDSAITTKFLKSMAEQFSPAKK